MVIKSEDKVYNSAKECFADLEREEAERPWWLKVWEDYIYYPLYRLWKHRIAMFPREVKWFIQRGKRGYSDCDVWGYCDFITDTTIGAVKQLKDNLHGCPGALADGCPVEEGVKKWEAILDKIIHGFEMNKKLLKWEKISEQEEKERKEGLDLFIYWMNNLWD